LVLRKKMNLLRKNQFSIPKKLYRVSFFGELFNKFCFSILLQAQINTLYPYAKEKKFKTSALEKAFKKLFEKQIDLNDSLIKEAESQALQKEIDEKKLPKWDCDKKKLITITQMLPLTENYVNMNKEYKIHKEVQPSFKLIYEAYLTKYIKCLEYSDLVCLFTSRNDKKGFKGDREVCALNGMVVIYPELHKENYRETLVKSPGKTSKLRTDAQSKKLKIQTSINFS